MVAPVSGHAGANVVRFDGRLSASKKLTAGTYQATVTAHGVNLGPGPNSAVGTLRFTIVK